MLRWQDTHFSERRRKFLVSYIPSFTDCSWVQPFSACASSHFSAGPWQASQNTPSVMSNFGPRAAAGTFTAWHVRQRSLARQQTSQDHHRERGIRFPTQHDSTSSHSRPPRRSRGGGACSCGSSFFGAGALGGDGGSSLTV